jgi:hypothetical protein
LYRYGINKTFPLLSRTSGYAPKMPLDDKREKCFYFERDSGG